MTSQTEVADIITVLRKAVSEALSEPTSNVVVELKEFSRFGQILNVTGTFKVTPFFVKRTGKVYGTLVQSETGLTISSLRIEEEKGL